MATRSDELRMTLLGLALLGLLLLSHTAAPVEATGGGVRKNSFSMNSGGARTLNSFSMNSGGARTLNSFSMNSAGGEGKGPHKGAGGDGF